MSTHYRVYGNGGLGWNVPVDLTMPITTVTDGSTAADISLADGDWLIVVRAYDSVSGLEDANLDATRLRLRNGVDMTGLPDPPTDLSVVDQGSGNVLILWTVPTDSTHAPTEYRVWATADTVVDDSGTPNAIVPHLAITGLIQSTTLTLTPGTSYAIGVRAANAVGTSTLVDGVSITPMAVGPDPVDGLAGEAS